MAFSSSLGPLLTLLLVLASCVSVFSEGCNVNVTREENRCIWFGVCAQDDTYVPGSKLDCFDNNPARNVSSMGAKFQNMLEETCPQYMEGGRVCCDYSMLDALTTQIKYPQQLFSRCPACLNNFVAHFCATTCDPNQSLFMNPTECRDGKTSAGVKNPAIANIDIYLSMDYAHDLYNSCSNVQYPQASNRVVDIMCGGTDTCDPFLWLDYLGDASQNHNSPFMMKYKFGDDNVTSGVQPKENSFIPCDTNLTKYRCSCADCETPDLCPAPPLAPQNHFPKSTVEFSILGVGLFLSFAIFIVAMIFGFFLCVAMVRERNGGQGFFSSKGGYGTLGSDDSPTSSVGSINAADVKMTEVAIKPPRSLCMPCYISGAHLENWIKIVFYHWGIFVATFWPLVIAVGLGLVAVITLLTVALHFTGTLPFTITTDPVKLWSASDSRARLEKNYFDENFGPFYRTEMIIFTAKDPTNYTTFQPVGVPDGSWTFGPVLTDEVLHEIYNIQEHLMNMEVEGPVVNGNETNVTLADICFAPLVDVDETASTSDCAVMSILNYFQNNLTRLDYTEDFGLINNSYHIYYCTRDPTAPAGSYFKNTYFPCLGEFGGPVDPNVALGGFNYLPNGSPNYNNATAIIVTFTVNNHVNDEDNQMAKIWEKAFLDYMMTPNLTHYTNITFSAERSIEDELARESKTDVFTVLLSYILMFAYITIFLGHIRKPFTVFIDMKLTIGFVGVLMVLLAVIASICFLNLTRVTATLIIIEVVPFLVLAVGVDNLFIMVHSYERQVKKFADAREGDISGIPIKELIGRAIAEVAPSLLLTSLSETTAFLLGAVSTMPAVRTFSLYAGVAVFFNFLLQISVFLAALSLDARRQLANRFDVLCCINLKGLFDPRKGLNLMQMIMNGFATVILSPIIRPFVLLFFGITSSFSLALMFRLEIGLDQTLALPKDSYLQPYFSNLYEYLHTGSPVYFVIKEGFNYSQPDYQAKFCSAAGCDKHSIGTEIFGYSRNSHLTGIAEPGMLWLDTYFEWIAPDSKCCGIVPATKEHCITPQYKNSTCTDCVTTLNENGWPYPDDFEKFLPWFLDDNPGMRCPSGGHAAFSSGVKLKVDNETGDATVETSYVMTYHTIMSNSSSFISGLKWARELGDKLTNYTGVEIFPYSVFYVFYEQYLTTIHDMGLNISLSIAAVFVVTFLMMGLNLWAALIVMLIVCMIIIHMIGCMALSGINANAVSLVNLVMTVGIAVEFCSHIVRWFCSCSLPTRTERAHSALAHMGASVVSGITLTKLIGVFVLFFAKSQIFEVYYFRMYMFMLLWGALHGLVFLPVLLSYLGPSYVPIAVIPPYNDPTILHATPPTNSIPKVTKKGKSPVSPSAIPDPTHNSSQNVQYPSLPNVGDYRPGIGQRAEEHAFVGSAQQQQYPQATYPGQNHYQQRGEVYPQPNEHSRLLKQ